jgi:2-polyprenyl-3-methyl-5-hydroxy-6-metoxy-1,4-benzoquinol methylase
MPYWAQPWPAGVLLAEAVLQGERGGGREAIEIGCGIGLVALAAATMGWRVTAGDYDEDALAFVSLNAERNGVQLASVERIDFRTPLPEPRYDHILGADLLYEARNCQPVARWIGSALRRGGTAVLSDPNRTAAESFVEHAEAAGLRLELEHVQTIAPAGLLTRGRLWRITHETPPAGGNVSTG